MILDELYDVLMDRKINPKEGSYTSKLLYHQKGVNKILEKLGEECVELILAVKDGKREEIVYETADLVYHLLVLLVKLDIKLEEIWKELERRRK
ncbi:phosphoribosyl-ATP diphosphatase [Archaeoglobus profundus]|uniref:Phosphoribosyl-ATP pyrophosphatase n=1 Tax=Archaeoglobus profundus (strain DSM 5631 / JCM 9629 / NBRC 100127 / Av18) TaxID=572546 RepID=D2RE04_ARCPA|nr:phosphoribosyl-ATP diphosphatase [Archaeoglobus profundus]ADB58348.1 phosphoribosyl-ATP diphosphatase [Archaeoglobus profundus DSM 5631]